MRTREVFSSRHSLTSLSLFSSACIQTFADRPTLDCVLKHFQRTVKIKRGVWSSLYNKPGGFKCIINEPQGNEWFKFVVSPSSYRSCESCRRKTSCPIDAALKD